MSRTLFVRLLASTALVAVAGFDRAEAGGGRQVLLLPLDAKLGGIPLERGYYRVSWSEESSLATLRIEKDGATVVEATGARIVPAEAHATDRVGLVRTQGDAPSLTRIQLADRRFALDLQLAVARRPEAGGVTVATAASARRRVEIE